MTASRPASEAQARAAVHRPGPAAARIVYYVEGDEFGGVERHLLDVLGRLDRSRFDPIVMGVMHPELVSRLPDLKVPARVLPRVRSKFDHRSWRQVRAAIRDEHPAILHAMLSHSFADQYAIATAVMERTRAVLVTAHLPTPPSNRPQAWLRRMLMMGVDIQIAPSEWTRTELVRLGQTGRRVEIVANGIDTPALLPRDEARARLGVPPDAFVVGGSMRLVEWKRPDLLVDVAQLLSDVDVVLIGDGPERAALEASGKSTGRVHMAGFQPDAPGLLTALDVFVHPCPHDNQPIAVLEAMASGVPVVVADQGGAATMIDHEHTGLRASPTAKDLAAAIDRLRRDRNLREACRNAALTEVATCFSIGAMVDRLEALYDELLASNRRGWPAVLRSGPTRSSSLGVTS